MMREGANRLLLALVILVVLLGAGVHIAQWLRAAPLWVDEEMIALNVRDRPFTRLPGQLWLGQSAPLGWLFIQRVVVLAVGTGELALRLFPLLFGIALLVAAAWTAVRWMGAVSAVILVLMLTLGEWISHYTFELKHYSADTFWALLLPALAAWALEHNDLDWRARRRWAVWWIVAAVGQLFGNGAMLVTPGCAVVMVAVILFRHGVRAVVPFLLASTVWFVTFAAHYLLSLQYTANSRFLWTIWEGEVRPASAGFVETLRWAASRFEPIAERPGGATRALVLWMGALSGFMFTRRRMLAALFCVIPISAFVLGVLRVVPLHDRFALWIVPALYVGVALLLDAGIHHSVFGVRHKRWVRVVGGVLLIGVATAAAADVLTQGRRHLDIGVPADNNHGVDDRTAVKWLLNEARPGDAVVTTRLGWPAIWWYGKIPLLPRPPGGRLPGDIPMVEIFHQVAHPECGRELATLAAQHRRLIVYIGFPDHRPVFREVVVHELRKVGRLVETRDFAALSTVLVVETGEPELSSDIALPAEEAGCVGVGVARRW